MSTNNDQTETPTTDDDLNQAAADTVATLILTMAEIVDRLVSLDRRLEAIESALSTRE